VSRNRKQAQLLGAFGLLGAAALPWMLWRRAIREIFGQFRVDVHYLVSELTPWVLIAVGLLFLLPVALSAGRDPDSRWYPRARNAYAAWGITLYLLGLGLGSQVAQIWKLSTF
jgi:hypothetical protein